MTSKKGRFGFTAPLAKIDTQPSDGWFDPSSFLLTAQDILPEDPIERPRNWIGRLFVFLAAFVLIFRLTGLQIVEGSTHRYLAEGNRVRRQITVAPRGSIVDRKGNPLVTNIPGYNLEVVPSELPRKRADREATLAHLSSVTGVAYETLIKSVEAAGYGALDPVTLKANIVREEALAYKVKLATTAGVRVSYTATRRYDTTPGLGHILGYTSRMSEQDITKHPDYHRSSPIGRAGIESSYDSVLRGHPGAVEIEVNANGQIQRQLRNTPPKVGETLRLTLDKGLQAEMAAALTEAMHKNGAQQAAAVAMDPRTGGILASVSLPSYDNNLFAQVITNEQYKKLSEDEHKPLLNRVNDGVYPPGSTVKPFVAAGGLQEKTITPATRLDTSVGVIKIGQWEFPDWKVHGVTDVTQAIAESNDIFFYALGGGWDKIPGLGLERINKYYRMFGFGEETGLDYATESKGLVPDNDWKKRVKKESWYIGDTYHVSIGQGNMLATPLQLVRSLSGLINGGNLPTPHIVAETESPETGNRTSLEFTTKKINLDKEVFDTVYKGMRRTVDSDTGSARALKSLPFSSAGKTGTAQFGTEEKTHAWYIGYAPYENPEIAVAVIVEGGGEGNAISVPVAGRVFSYYMANK